jgi:hypothetical protein
MELGAGLSPGVAHYQRLLHQNAMAGESYNLRERQAAFLTTGLEGRGFRVCVKTRGFTLSRQ